MKRGSLEEFLDGVGLAAACEAGDVDERNFARGSDIYERVESGQFFTGGGTLRGVGERRHDSIKTILHVGDEVFGMGDGRFMRVSLGEGEKLAVQFKPQSLSDQFAVGGVAARSRSGKSRGERKMRRRAWLIVDDIDGRRGGYAVVINS